MNTGQQVQHRTAFTTNHITGEQMDATIQTIADDINEIRSHLARIDRYKSARTFEIIPANKVEEGDTILTIVRGCAEELLITQIERHVLDGTGELTPEQAWMLQQIEKHYHATPSAAFHAIRIHIIGDATDFWLNEHDKVAAVIPE